MSMTHRILTAAITASAAAGIAATANAAEPTVDPGFSVAKPTNQSSELPDPGFSVAPGSLGNETLDAVAQALYFDPSTDTIRIDETTAQRALDGGELDAEIVADTQEKLLTLSDEQIDDALTRNGLDPEQLRNTGGIVPRIGTQLDHITGNLLIASVS